MEKEMIYKSRGFSSCINSAYHLMGDNMKSIIRSTWLPVLLVSLLSGMIAVLNIPSSDVFTFGITHFGLYVTLFIVGILGILACSIWLVSRLMSMLNDLPRRWNFKRVLLATLYIILIDILVTIIITAAFYAGVRMTGGNPLLFLMDNWLVILAVAVIVLLALLPFCYIVMRYLYDKDARFWLDFSKSYKTGARHLGFIFITTLLTSIIVGVIIMVATIPLGILNIANLLSNLGQQMGDPATLPGYFLPLLFITTVLITMVLLYIYMFQMIVYLFIYGSIEKEEEERHHMETPPVDNLPSEDPHLPLQQLT